MNFAILKKLQDLISSEPLERHDNEYSDRKMYAIQNARNSG